MTLRSLWLAVLAGPCLALAMSATMFAYAGQVVEFLTISGPSGSVPCLTVLTLHATATDASGAPIEGQSIDWALTETPSDKDTVHSTTTVTDADGVATTTLTLACVLGQRTVTATGDNATASTTDDVSAGAVLSVTSGGLPRTSTTPVGVPPGLPSIPTLLAILAVLAGSGIILRRLALRTR